MIIYKLLYNSKNSKRQQLIVDPEAMMHVTFRSRELIGAIPRGLLDFLTPTFAGLPDVRHYLDRACAHNTSLLVCTMGHAHAHHRDDNCAHIRTKDMCVGGTTDVVLRVDDTQMENVVAQMARGWIVVARDTVREYECISRNGPCCCNSARGDLHSTIRGPSRNRPATSHHHHASCSATRPAVHPSAVLPAAGRVMAKSSAFSGAAGRFGRAAAAFRAP